MQIVPRPLGQVLSDAMNALARVWKPLLSSALMVFIPIGLIALAAFEITGATEFLDLVFNDPEYLAGLSAVEFLDAAEPFLQAAVIGLVLQGLGAVYLYLVATHIMAVDAAGYQVGGREARRHALRRYGVAFLASLLVTIALAAVFALGLLIWSIPAVLVGTPNPTSVLIALVLFLALVGPGIWLAVSMAMYAAVVAVESVGPVAAIRRSFGLVKGRWWPTFGFLLLVGLLGFVAVQLIQLVAIPLIVVGDLAPGVSLASALGIAGQGVIVACYGAMYAAWYIDLRSRIEPLAPTDLN